MYVGIQIQCEENGKCNSAISQLPRKQFFMVPHDYQALCTVEIREQICINLLCCQLCLVTSSLMSFFSQRCLTLQKTYFSSRKRINIFLFNLKSFTKLSFSHQFLFSSKSQTIDTVQLFFYRSKDKGHFLMRTLAFALESYISKHFGAYF